MNKLQNTYSGLVSNMNLITKVEGYHCGAKRCCKKYKKKSKQMCKRCPKRADLQ